MNSECPGCDIERLRIRGNFPNQRSLLCSVDNRCLQEARSIRRLPGYSPPIAEYWRRGDAGGSSEEAAVRDIDLALLCQPDLDKACLHMSTILRARDGNRAARKKLDTMIKRSSRELKERFDTAGLVENRFVVPSSSDERYRAVRVSHKGVTLLRLSQLGHPVPDFVILTSDTYTGWEQSWEEYLGTALENLERLTGQKLGASDDPLIFAVRCAMPEYIPGVMPTYLNVGVTDGILPALEQKYGIEVARKIYLNNLKNLFKSQDREAYESIRDMVNRAHSLAEIDDLIDRIATALRKRDRSLLEDPFRQAAFLLTQSRDYFEKNTDLLITFSKGERHYPAIIMQKMVCSVRDDQSYVGVLYSRHSQSGEGLQLEFAHNIFGEDIMTGTVEPQQISFESGNEIKDDFSAVAFFSSQLQELEREFESPVTIEFAAEGSSGHQFFALLQLNKTDMSGRAAFISTINLLKEGTISRRQVPELILPYHIKQMESDTIEESSFRNLDLFGSGISIIPRSAVCAQIYFTAEAALRAKRRGESVCLCKKSFVPSDTVVMREMNAILSLTSAAIHVVTICRSFGIPALLSLEKNGVALLPDGDLINASGTSIKEGDWVTVSSRRQAFFLGKAKFKPARLVRYMNGEDVKFEEGEREVFDNMAYAYRYYQQLVRGLKLDQIFTLNELVRLVNLELRGEKEEARKLVRAWFDTHESIYVDEILVSELGDHLNQHTVFEMLELGQKKTFFKRALAKCRREGVSGLKAGAFMLGRFLSLPKPVSFWRAFDGLEIGLLVNEWVLFEKYMQVLYEVGERKVLRAKKKILENGLDKLHLHPGSVTCLMPLKLSGVPLDQAAKSAPACCDPQTLEVLQLLQRPYREFYDFESTWSLKDLEDLCAANGVPIPEPDDC
jgi:hypothetical protein